MNPCLPQKTNIVIRSAQYRDLEAISKLCAEASVAQEYSCSIDELARQLEKVRTWYRPLKFLSVFPNPFRYEFCAYVAEQERQIVGMIQVAPFNRTRSTWRVERVLVDPTAQTPGSDSATGDIGSQLLRHCFETILDASTWLLEVNIHHKSALALYRQNGFQPLAQLTYWEIAPEFLEKLTQHEPDLPNLLSVSNSEAQLLYQLDTVSMPPLLRQVFDRQIHDFKASIVTSFFTRVKQWFSHTDSVAGYVFEPQRKAAIGYFHVRICRDGKQPNIAQLTVHPAYTWLYPELFSQMARITQNYPSNSLQIASSDYQPEREEFLEQLGAERIEHTILMSRSVWHKLREAKPMSLEGLQLADVLQSLKPSRQPVPSRIEWLKSLSKKIPASAKPDLAQSVSTPNCSLSDDAGPSSELPDTQQNGHQY